MPGGASGIFLIDKRLHHSLEYEIAKPLLWFICKLQHLGIFTLGQIDEDFFASPQACGGVKAGYWPIV